MVLCYHCVKYVVVAVRLRRGTEGMSGMGCMGTARSYFLEMRQKAHYEICLSLTIIWYQRRRRKKWNRAACKAQRIPYTPSNSSAKGLRKEVAREVVKLLPQSYPGSNRLLTLSPTLLLGERNTRDQNCCFGSWKGPSWRFGSVGWCERR